MRPDLVARFEAKYEPEPMSGCWIWTAARLHFGHGAFAVTHGVQDRAHRISWQIAHGPIPAGMNVLHRCDNPPCVNPAHLFLGTQVENVEDMRRKGRAAGGERNSHAVLTADQVREIRAVYGAGGISYREMARRYGVTDVMIRNIVVGRAWRCVA